MQKKYGIIITIAVALALLIAVAVIVYLSNKQTESQESASSNTTVVEENEDDMKEEKEEPQEIEEEDSKEEIDESQLVPMKTTSNVNLRTEPNTDCEIIVVIPGGTEVQMISWADPPGCRPGPARRTVLWWFLRFPAIIPWPPGPNQFV